MDKVHRPSDSECYASRSEPFRNYVFIIIIIIIIIKVIAVCSGEVLRASDLVKCFVRVF
jgi:hypothetical protein